MGMRNKTETRLEAVEPARLVVKTEPDPSEILNATTSPSHGCFPARGPHPKGMDVVIAASECRPFPRIRNVNKP